MSNKVVVRFAPSPTGPLHIGGLRTALYNYLFARKHGGTFILRIEDTDQTRYVAGAEDYIKEALQWCGMDYDHGPQKGGPNGPYRQSERSAIYKKYTQQLLDDGKAYLAFDTAEELQAMRDASAYATYGHDTRMSMKNSLSLSQAEVKKLLDANTPHVVRIIMPKGEEIKFVDAVRGEVSFMSDELDDKVLLKSDGLPTYHLANVVDDHLMEITHVIRGEEWLSSVPLHIMLYKAFGWADSQPIFVHLPLILKPDPQDFLADKSIRTAMTSRMAEEIMEAHDELHVSFQPKVENLVREIFNDRKNFANRLKIGKKDQQYMRLTREYLRASFSGKLSKRDGDRLGFPVFPLAWTDPKNGKKAPGYRETGYIPAALLNALALLGWNPGSDEEIIDSDRLTALFSLEKINKSGARFSARKMQWFNQQYLKNTPASDLLDETKAQLITAGLEMPSDDFVAQVIDVMKMRVTFGKEIAAQAVYFFKTPESYDENMLQKRWNEESAVIIEELASRWAGVSDWNSENLTEIFEAFTTEKELPTGKVLAPLRLALTGVAGGPGVFDIAAIIGKKESLHRMELILKKTRL